LKRSKALDSFPESLQYAECVCSLTVLSKSLFVSISWYVFGFSDSCLHLTQFV